MRRVRLAREALSRSSKESGRFTYCAGTEQAISGCSTTVSGTHWQARRVQSAPVADLLASITEHAATRTFYMRCRVAAQRRCGNMMSIRTPGVFNRTLPRESGLAEPSPRQTWEAQTRER